MMAAFGADRDTVSSEDLDAAIRELQWVEYTSRTNRLQVVEPPADGAQQPSPGSGPVIGRILIAHEGKTAVERSLRPGRLVIGRTSDNDLQIDSKFISRHHCQLVTQMDSCVIEDLNSTNGIYVQSKRVRRHHLNDGDIVVVGQHELMYIDERAPRPRSATDLSDTEVIDKVGE
jgi:pSer/pThr/pTyr-binding forkhead associated (FHA) protein